MPKKASASASAPQWTAARSEKNLPTASKKTLRLWPIEVEASAADTPSSVGRAAVRYKAPMAARAGPSKRLTVAVTGPTGEIGQSVVAALERSREVARVHGMARRAFDPRAQGWRKVSYRRGDVLDERAVAGLVERADVVIHLAFIIMGSASESRKVNLDGSRTVFQAAAAADRQPALHADLRAAARASAQPARGRAHPQAGAARSGCSLPARAPRRRRERHARRRSRARTARRVQPGRARAAHREDARRGARLVLDPRARAGGGRRRRDCRAPGLPACAGPVDQRVSRARDHGHLQGAARAALAPQARCAADAAGADRRHPARSADPLSAPPYATGGLARCSDLSTSASCSAGLTFRSTSAMRPSGSITNVVRSLPK